MSSINDALLNLENQISWPSQQGVACVITDAERKHVISWLTIKGVWNPSHNSNEVLGKLYGIPNYLNSVLNNQKTGKNKYKTQPKPTGTMSFETSDDETSDSYTSSSFLPPSNLSTDQEEKENISGTHIPNSQIRPLVESIVRETISQAIATEISSQRNEQKILNQKFQEEITKFVHTGVNNILQKSLETNREIAKTTAREITNSKIKHENQNLKNLVEEIIFSTYLNHKANNPITPERSEGPFSSPEIPNTNPSFIPTLDPSYHFDPYATRVIKSAIATGENLYVYGDTGCGKTTHLEQVCSVLGKGLIRINPHDGITREMFLGGMKLINNETIFIEGALPLAMRNGYVFLVDEISFLPPNLTAILNPIGEKGGKLYIPETSEWISPAQGFCIFATDNTGGKGDRTGNYTGTEVQNTATLDRFAFCLKMDYLPADKEIEMLINRFPNQNIAEIEKLQHLALEIRKAFSIGQLSITLSTRKLIKFFDQRQNGFNISEALQNTLVSWLDEDDEQLVKTMIDRLDLLNLVSTSSPEVNISKDWYDFTQHVKNNEMINAIKTLRQIAGANLGLREAKEATESYRDGFITIQELQKKILSGRMGW